MSATGRAQLGPNNETADGWCLTMDPTHSHAGKKSDKAGAKLAEAEAQEDHADVRRPTKERHAAKPAAPDMTGPAASIADPLLLMARIGYRVYLTRKHGGDFYKGYINAELRRLAQLRGDELPADPGR